MKRIIFLTILISSIILINKIPAQNKFHIGLNSGYVFQGASEGLFSAGKNAFTIGLNTSYSIFPAVRLNLLTGYYNFPNYSIFSAGLFYAFATTLPAEAYNISVEEKTAAKVYQIGFGISVANYQKSSIFPFFAIYSGIYFFNYEKRIYYSYWLNGINSTFPYITENISEKKGFISIGFGLQYPVSDVISLNLQGKYSITFDKINKSQDLIPVMFGFEYSL
ncbi:MAG TPA: hypothetical protein VKA26_07355 [Ignavibacteriaceae bacterium]|nr:hypothetical protein [Ignavibacteriaceae bacterium]